MTTVAVLALTGLTAPAVQAQPADLFAPVEQSLPSDPLDDVVVRSRVAMIDLEQLHRAHAAVAGSSGPAPFVRAAATSGVDLVSATVQSAPLILNLFDDSVITGLVEYAEPTFSGGYALSGRLVEAPLGTVTLVVNDERVVGTVRLPGETYRIRSLDGGVVAISEVEEPPFECGVDGLQPEPDHRH